MAKLPPQFAKVRRRPADGWVLAEFQTSDLNEGRMIETFISGCLWDSNLYVDGGFLVKG